MARVSKYEGGSKAKSFRLPAKRFDEAKATIKAYLQRFESKPGLNNKIGWPVTPEEAFIDKGTKMIDALPDFLKKPPAIAIDVTGSIWPNINNPNERLRVTSNGEHIISGVRLSGKEYYDLNMANIPSEKAKEFFLAATPGEPEKRIPGTLKKKLQELDPNIIIPDNLKK